jgi:hypothetical protein
MSKLLIHQYYSNLDKVLQFGKSRNEQTIRVSFSNLLIEYARKQNEEALEEKFYTYRFADYKDQVIDLLKRVCRVSVETMKIIHEMDNINI